MTSKEETGLDDIVIPEATGNWTREEVDRLVSLWDAHDIPTIAKKLGRKRAAVAIKASRLKLPPMQRRQPHQQAALSNPKAKVRPCLRCKTSFFSEGSHHRICDKCKSSAMWGGGQDSTVWS